MKAQAQFIDYRQVLAVDRRGKTAIHSGRNCARHLGAKRGPKTWRPAAICWPMHRVPQAVVDGFLASSGHIWATV